MQVVDDPEAFLAVDQHTLVYGVGRYAFFYEIISQDTWPAAFITGLLEWISSKENESGYGSPRLASVGRERGLRLRRESCPSSEAEIQRMKNMTKGYEQEPISQLEDSNAFEGLILHWRPAQRPQARVRGGIPPV